MTRLTEDPTLVLPVPPERIPSLTGEVAGLAIASPAGGRRLLVEGEAVALVGSERGAIEAVRVAGRTVASDVEWEDGAVANVVIHPGLVRRERVGGSGPASETILAAPTLPLVAFQRSVDESATARLGLALHVEGAEVRFRKGRGSVVVAERGADAGLAVTASPPDAALRLLDDGKGRLRLEVLCDRPGPLTVLLAAGPLERVRSALSSGTHLAAHARRAADVPVDDGLVVTSGVDEVDDGVLWARARLTSGLARADQAHADRGPPDAVWAAAAALGMGDQASAERAIELVQKRGGAPAPAGPAAAADLLIHRAALTFGGAAWTPMGGAGRTEAGGAPRRGPATSSVAGSGREARSLDAGGIRLPVLGAPADEETALAWLASLLEGEPTHAPRAPSPAEERPFRLPWLFRADPDQAWAWWRRAVAQGLAGGPLGVATWDPLEEPDQVLLPITSALLSAVAFGLLGLAPDAPAGRLRVAPRFPTHLTRFDVSGLTVGPVRLSLSYERDGGLRRFTLEPERAQVPPMVVFEPAVEGVVREARVDGAVADLETRAAGARTVVPVQLPIDRARTIEIICA